MADFTEVPQTGRENIMRIIGLATLSLMLLAGCASGLSGGSGVYSAYKPPEVGTLLTVKTTDATQASKEIRQLVVANGADFAVYKNIGVGLNKQSKADYFIEYSGLYWQVCSDLQPSKNERKALKKMWPLKEGHTTKISAPNGSEGLELLDVTVEQIGVFVSEVFGEQSIFKVRTAFTTPEITMYAPDLGSALIIDWGEIGAKDYAGFDELVGIEKLSDLSRYKNQIDYGEANCVPEK